MYGLLKFDFFGFIGLEKKLSYESQKKGGGLKIGSLSKIKKKLFGCVWNVSKWEFYNNSIWQFIVLLRFSLCFVRISNIYQMKLPISKPSTHIEKGGDFFGRFRPPPFFWDSYPKFDFRQKFLSWCRNFCVKIGCVETHFFSFLSNFVRNFCTP